jgi:hypothetical protein
MRGDVVFGFALIRQTAPSFIRGSDSCAPRLSVGNFASCSFKRARTVDAALAAAAVHVALLTFFVATFHDGRRRPLRRSGGSDIGLVLSFRNLRLGVFILARLVLIVLRATRIRRRLALADEFGRWTKKATSA